MKDDLFQKALAFHQDGKLKKAIHFYQETLKAQPAHENAWGNLAVALSAKGHHVASEQAYLRALAIDASVASVWSNYGNLLVKMERFFEADQAHQKALQLAPRDAGFHYNAGNSPFYSSRPELAIRHYEACLKFNPKHDQAVWNQGLAMLQMEQWKAGFQRYEMRLNTHKEVLRNRGGKLWDRQTNLSGKTVLLTTEQGFGDVIQFSRFIQSFQAQNRCEIILECQTPLATLMQHSLNCRVVTQTPDSTEYDVYFPLLSVPSVLVQSENFQVDVPAYLKTLSQKQDIREALEDIKQDNKFKVAINWKSKARPYDRTIPLEELVAAIGGPDVSIYSLQFGDDASQIQEKGLASVVRDLSPMIGDFHDSGVFMETMDLVITVDSAPAHVAGGLGVPCFVLLHEYSDWRWGLHRTKSLWYTNTTMLRQQKQGMWESVLVQLKKEIPVIVAQKMSR